MKVLVIRFSSIGDIVLTTPVLRCLKQQKPGMELHYLSKAAYKDILISNPYIDKLHYLEADIGETIKKLKEEEFDYVIDLHHNLRTARVKRALGKKSFSFPKLNVRKWIYVNFKKNLLPDKSIVERYFEAVKPLGITNDGQGLDYFIPEKSEVTHFDIPMSHWAGYIACVVGGSYATKRLPVEKWKELCSHLPIPIILMGGREDIAAAKQIAELDPVKIYNACGKFNINESADLVRRAKVVISNDTGLMHIAAAFKKPIISLWGNTSPEMGMFPYYGFNNLKERVDPRSLIIENNNLTCRPCSKIGYNRCPKGHFNCMNKLLFSEINIFLKKYI